MAGGQLLDMGADTTEHQGREGATPHYCPVEGAPGPSAETDRDAEAPTGIPNAAPPGGAPAPSAETGRDAEAPTGIPNEGYEATPLGTSEEDPDGKPHGENAMPGTPPGGEPPSAG